MSRPHTAGADKTSADKAGADEVCADKAPPDKAGADKATADAGWENMQQDEAMMDLMQQAPLDGKRMIFAGFDLALDM